MRCLWECKLVQLLQKTGWHFLEKIKIDLSYDPAIPLLHKYIQKKRKQGVLKRYLYTHIHSSITHDSEKVEAT